MTAASRPNILLVIFDSLGARDLDAQGTRCR